MIYIQGKPDFDEAFGRVNRWLAHEPTDRPLVRFSEHNAEYSVAATMEPRNWPDLRSRWFDAEYQVDRFIESIRLKTFLGETFPVFWPNLGPNVYAAFHGCELEYGEVTSWIRHRVRGRGDLSSLKFNPDNIYFRKIEELTHAALSRCQGSFMVGYTDLHGSLDCVADWRDPQELCLDIADDPDFVHSMLGIAAESFLPVFDHFDALLKAHGQMSVTWMGVPSAGKMHIPSCDFTSMVATGVFEEFYLPHLKAEVRHMTHNIFHLDGKGMLRHLDRILEIPEINAIQWVHGVGDDAPIMQWIPTIRRIQEAGKGVMVDLKAGELESFIPAIKPDGLFLCIAAEDHQQPAILRRVEQW